MDEHGACNGSVTLVAAKAQILKGFIFDVDGVLTDNRVEEGSERKPKFRSYYDGQGVSLLRAIGVKICLVTNEKGVSARHIEDVVERWNSFPSSKSDEKPDGWEHVRLFTGMGGEKKVVATEEWFQETGLTWEVCGAMGDDLVDVAMLRRACFTAAPASAELAIRHLVNFVTNRPGGYGAVRDVVNFILDVRGIDQLELPPQ